MPWLERVLVGVDFSVASLAALHYGSFLAEFYEARLDVVHVLARCVAQEESWVVRDDLLRLLDRGARLRRLLEESPHGAAREAVARIEIGDPAEALAAVARARDADLVVIGENPARDARRKVLSALQASDVATVIAVRPDVRVPAIAQHRRRQALSGAHLRLLPQPA